MVIVENENKDDLSIEEIKAIVEKINSGTKTSEMASQLSMSTKILKMHLKSAGYYWRGSKYFESGEFNYGDFVELEDAIKEQKREDNKVKATFKISKDIQKLIKLQAIVEDIDLSSVIEKSVLNYVSSETKEMFKKL